MAENKTTNLDKVRFWVQNYAISGGDDQRCVEDLVECENREVVEPFRMQLHRIAKGECAEEYLDKLVGKKRKVKYGSYENWAKLMLLWLSKFRAS